MAAAEKLLPALAETLHVPPRRDLSFYLVLFVAVLPIWSIVPLSWAFVAYSLLYQNVSDLLHRENALTYDSLRRKQKTISTVCKRVRVVVNTKKDDEKG